MSKAFIGLVLLFLGLQAYAFDPCDNYYNLPENKKRECDVKAIGKRLDREKQEEYQREQLDIQKKQLDILRQTQSQLERQQQAQSNRRERQSNDSKEGVLKSIVNSDKYAKMNAQEKSIAVLLGNSIDFIQGSIESMPDDISTNAACGKVKTLILTSRIKENIKLAESSRNPDVETILTLCKMYYMGFELIMNNANCK